MKSSLTVTALLFFMMVSSAHVVAADDIDVSDMDAKMEVMGKKTEYYQAMQRLNEARHSAFETAKSSDGQSSAGPSPTTSTLPRNLRGRSSGDGIRLDENGRIVREAPPAEAYVASVFGVNGYYSAQVVWGDREFSVRKGDDIIGGNWLVKSVTQSGVTLSNGERRVVLSSVPVPIAAFAEGGE